MLTFIVPVKSKLVTADWDKFSQLFEQTLRSICNQIDQNFKVVVVCHEKPSTTFFHQNVHFLKVDFEPPFEEAGVSSDSLYRGKELDKGKKILLGIEYASMEFNTDYIMTVDSDDYISNKISSYVNCKGTGIPGWYLKKGYIHFEGKKFLVKTFKFNQLCGSSIIVKPKLFKYFIGVDETFYFDHRLTILNENIELKRIPFAGGIYNVGNGENIYMSTESVKKFNDHGNWISGQSLKRLYQKSRNYRFRFITSRMREEFSFYSDVSAKSEYFFYNSIVKN